MIQEFNDVLNANNSLTTVQILTNKALTKQSKALVKKEGTLEFRSNKAFDSLEELKEFRTLNNFTKYYKNNILEFASVQLKYDLPILTDIIKFKSRYLNDFKNYNSLEYRYLLKSVNVSPLNSVYQLFKVLPTKKGFALPKPHTEALEPNNFNIDFRSEVKQLNKVLVTYKGAKVNDFFNNLHKEIETLNLKDRAQIQDKLTDIIQEVFAKDKNLRFKIENAPILQDLVTLQYELENEQAENELINNENKILEELKNKEIEFNNAIIKPLDPKRAKITQQKNKDKKIAKIKKELETLQADILEIEKIKAKRLIKPIETTLATETQK